MSRQFMIEDLARYGIHVVGGTDEEIEQLYEEIVVPEIMLDVKTNLAVDDLILEQAEDGDEI